MDNEKITVLVVEPKKKPYVKKIESGLESLQREVGGYIQAVYPFDSPCAIVCDEEAKLKGSPLNRALRDDEGHIYDVISGTFLVVGLGEENFASLSDKDMKDMSERFGTPELFMKMNGKLAIIPMAEKKTSVLEKLERKSQEPTHKKIESHEEVR